MLKSFSICAALILAAAAFSTSAEAQHRGFGGGARMGGGAHFSGARMGGFSGARMGGWSGARFAGPARMGIAGPGRFAGPGRVAWAGGGNWAGRRWAGNWNRGYWRGGRWWPWGVGAGVALAAATWPYYGGYGYSDSLRPVGARLRLGERLQLSSLRRLRLLLITNCLIRGFFGPGFTIAWPFLLARRAIKMPPFRFPF